MSRGTLYKVERYTRFEIRARPAWLYVFGDNMRRRGSKGQALEARDEPNAVGIPTKWAPGTHQRDYFFDGDFDAVKHILDAEFAKLEAHLAAGGNVVWPADGIGTGLAELPTRAPKIHAYIEERLKRLETHDQP